MIDTSALSRAMIVGTVLQVVLALLANLSDWIAQHALLFGAMMLSAIAGYLYAQDVSRGYLAGAAGGLVAGGVSGLFGAASSVVLGNTDPGLFVQNTLIFVLTGGVGGLFGQMAAVMDPARR
jgi:hypothetical protein